MTKSTVAKKSSSAKHDKPSVASKGGKISPSLQKTINHAAMLALENEDGPKVCRDELALQLNLKQRSLGNNLTTLEKAGLIFFDSKTVTLTELGMAQADTSGLVSAAPQNNDEHQQRLMVKYKLSGGEQKVLMELKDGSEKAKAAVAEKLGLKLRSFSNLLTNPKKSGLLEVNGQSIRLSDKMFIKKLGRPCDHN